MIYFQRFYEKYRYVEDEKISDSFHEGINILPFTANPATSNFDNTCSIKGTTGEFFRYNSQVPANPVLDYTTYVEEFVVNYLKQKELSKDGIEKFKLIMKDLMCTDGNFVPFNPSFLKYIPLDMVHKKGSPVLSKYGSGQKKLAEYLMSLIPNSSLNLKEEKNRNIFCHTIQEALEQQTQASPSKPETNYYVLPFIQQQFVNDIEWLLQKKSYVVLKYIDMLLYFYACYSITQTIFRLDAANKLNDSLENPESLYFILDNESTSERRDVVKQGWATKLPSEYVSKLYGRMQAVDMLNILLMDNENAKPIGLYKNLLDKIKETPFDYEIKNQCEKLLAYCKTGKYNALKKRTSGKKVDEIKVISDLSVNSYEDFFKKLESICKSYQSFEYHGRMLSRVQNLLKIRFLQTRRGRGFPVLVLDNEMLTFLIAMITREQRFKLKKLYQRFKEYGICFDLHTKQAIEAQLLKLNLLERRSDSGEAQYVRIIL